MKPFGEITNPFAQLNPGSKLNSGLNGEGLVFWEIVYLRWLLFWLDYLLLEFYCRRLWFYVSR